MDDLEDDDLKLGLNWIDEQEWELHRQPTVSDVVGNYPAAKNEVMMPTWILESLGISDPKVGRVIPLSYHLDGANVVETREFVLAGYYTDYSQVRTNDKGSIYASEAFKEEADLATGNVAMVSFEDGENIQSRCEQLQETLGFGPEQSFEIVPVTQGNNQTLIAAVVCVILFIFISSYLLIYIILYINVVRDIRFYGQLRLIGFTKREVRKIVHQQILFITMIGIPIGLVLGAVVSLGIVPYSLTMLYSGNSEVEMQVSFSPLIFIGAAVFAFVTARMGCIKPAGMAAQVSPISAMAYNEVTTKNLHKRKNKRFSPKSMAFQNIFRSKKSALLVFSSLFLGLALYWIATALLSSISPENFIQQWGEDDFAITYSIHDEGNLITSDMLEEIQAIPGIQDLKTTEVAEEVTFPVQYDDQVFGAYVDSLDGKAGVDFSIPEKRKAYTENFYSGVYGIDDRYIEELNRTLEEPLDVAAFKKGKLVLLQELMDEDGENLVQPGETITVEGEGELQEFEIADSFLPADFQSGRGNERGTAPDLYISKSALARLAPETKIFRISFDTDGRLDDEVLQQLKDITASDSNIQILSRVEKETEMAAYLLTTKVLTVGLSLTFLLTGILNFVTTMVTSVNSRKQEFAILESIGMTHQQQREILLFEGFYYWGISFGLLLTLGTMIYIPLYLLFKQIVPYAAFHLPLSSLALVLVAILLVCLLTPWITYRISLKEKLINRMNQ